MTQYQCRLLKTGTQNINIGSCFNAVANINARMNIIALPILLFYVILVYKALDKSKVTLFYSLDLLSDSSDISGSPLTLFSSSCHVNKSSTAWGTTFSKPVLMALICKKTVVSKL